MPNHNYVEQPRHAATIAAIRDIGLTIQLTETADPTSAPPHRACSVLATAARRLTRRRTPARTRFRRSVKIVCVRSSEASTNRTIPAGVDFGAQLVGGNGSLLRGARPAGFAIQTRGRYQALVTLRPMFRTAKEMKARLNGTPGNYLRAAFHKLME